MTISSGHCRRASFLRLDQVVFLVCAMSPSTVFHKQHVENLANVRVCILRSAVSRNVIASGAETVLQIAVSLQGRSPACQRLDQKLRLLRLVSLVLAPIRSVSHSLCISRHILQYLSHGFLQRSACSPCRCYQAPCRLQRFGLRSCTSAILITLSVSRPSGQACMAATE